MNKRVTVFNKIISHDYNVRKTKEKMEIILTHLLLMNISSELEPRVSPEWTNPYH